MGQVVGHGIEMLGHFPDLGNFFVGGHLHREITLGQLIERVADVLDRTDDMPAYRQGKDRSQ